VVIKWPLGYRKVRSTYAILLAVFSGWLGKCIPQSALSVILNVLITIFSKERNVQSCVSGKKLLGGEYSRAKRCCYTTNVIVLLSKHESTQQSCLGDIHSALFVKFDDAGSKLGNFTPQISPFQRSMPEIALSNSSLFQTGQPPEAGSTPFPTSRVLPWAFHSL